MIKKLANFGAIIFVSALFSGCAGNKPVEVPKKPVIKSIAVLPVNNPTWFSLENRNAVSVLIPVSHWAFKLDSRQKAQLFTDKMKEQQLNLGKDLTAVLVDGLAEQGYQVTVLEGVKGPSDDPEDFEHAGIKTDADAILHVYFTDVGVYASPFSRSYLPRVNMYGILFNPKDGEYIFDDSLYYGVDAREGKSWGIMADPKFSYTSFDALITEAPEVINGFAYGSQSLGKLMVQHIRDALREKPSKP